MADTGRTVWANDFWAADFWAAGFWSQAVAVPAAPRRRGGGLRVRNYIYKGKRYLGLTNEQLARLILDDVIDREEVKVVYKNKKPHKVSVDHWAELQETMRRINGYKPEYDDDEDLEDILALL